MTDYTKNLRNLLNKIDADNIKECEAALVEIKTAKNSKFTPIQTKLVEQIEAKLKPTASSKRTRKTSKQKAPKSAVSADKSESVILNAIAAGFKAVNDRLDGMDSRIKSLEDQKESISVEHLRKFNKNVLTAAADVETAKTELEKFVKSIASELDISSLDKVISETKSLANENRARENFAKETIESSQSLLNDISAKTVTASQLIDQLTIKLPTISNDIHNDLRNKWREELINNSKSAAQEVKTLAAEHSLELINTFSKKLADTKDIFNALTAELISASSKAKSSIGDAETSARNVDEKIKNLSSAISSFIDLCNAFNEEGGKATAAVRGTYLNILNTIYPALEKMAEEIGAEMPKLERIEEKKSTKE